MGIDRIRISTVELIRVEIHQMGIDRVGIDRGLELSVSQNYEQPSNYRTIYIFIYLLFLMFEFVLNVKYLFSRKKFLFKNSFFFCMNKKLSMEILEVVLLKSKANCVDTDIFPFL